MPGIDKIYNLIMLFASNTEATVYVVWLAAAGVAASIIGIAILYKVIRFAFDPHRDLSEVPKEFGKLIALEMGTMVLMACPGTMIALRPDLQSFITEIGRVIFG